MNPAVQSRDVDPFSAVEAQREALDQAGTVLPYPGADALPGLALVDPGRVRPEVDAVPARVIQQGSDSTGELTCQAVLGAVAGGRVPLPGGAVS